MWNKSEMARIHGLEFLPSRVWILYWEQNFDFSFHSVGFSNQLPTALSLKALFA
jgi:hypothetical protein